MGANRAECRLCGNQVESMSLHDYAECACGEIAVAGGPDKLLTYARDYNNFFRLDENGKRITVDYQGDKGKPEEMEVTGEKKTTFLPIDEPALTKSNVLEEFSRFIEDFERFPTSAQYGFASHYDLYRLALLVQAFLKVS